MDTCSFARCMVVVVLSALLSSVAQGVPNSILVAAVTPPGSVSPAQWGPVLMYGIENAGPLDPLLPIPAASLSDPLDLVFSSGGELFVSNRHGNVGGGVGSISRFIIDESGNFTPNGTIVGNGLEAVHGLAFSPSGELFAGSISNGLISRFLFDANGTAIPNGTFATPDFNNGLTFSDAGELFVTKANDTVVRFLFDGAGQAVANGSFTIPGAGQLNLLRFSPNGELFLPDNVQDVVYRVLFDAGGNASLNGSFPVLDATAIAFASSDDFFVTGHSSGGGISRFTLLGGGSVVPLEFIATESLAGLAIRPNLQSTTAIPESAGLGAASVAAVVAYLARRRRRASLSTTACSTLRSLGEEDKRNAQQ